MKKSVTIILTVIILFAFLCVAIAGYLYEDRGSITVMSFNIRCIMVEADTANNWYNRQDDVLNVILKYQPDIIGLQEVKKDQFDFLKKELGDIYGYYGVYRSAFIPISEAASIFYRKSRFEALNEDTFWLSETPDVMSRGWDASVERVCSTLTLKDKKTKKVFKFYNTHFDHRGSTAQEQSVHLLLNKINESGLPAIVTGDFNIRQDSTNYNNLVGGVLKDTKFLAPEESTDDGPTFNGFGNYNPAGKPIDFILISQGDFFTESYRIIRDKKQDGNYISDHFPVISVLKQL